MVIAVGSANAAETDSDAAAAFIVVLSCFI
jgi:hypothetical protein